MSAERKGEIFSLKSELERAAANIRFEQELRQERDRELKDREHRLADFDAQNGKASKGREIIPKDTNTCAFYPLRIALVKERLSEANAKVTLSKEENSKVEARIRILEREANAEKTSLLQEAGVKEDALRVQLRAVRVIMLLQALYENPSILSLFSFACNDTHRTGLLRLGKRTLQCPESKCRGRSEGGKHGSPGTC